MKSGFQSHSCFTLFFFSDKTFFIFSSGTL